MAENTAVKGSEVIDPKYLDVAINRANDFNKVLDNTEQVLKDVLKVSKDIAKVSTGTTKEDVNAVKQAYKQGAEAVKNLTEAQKKNKVITEQLVRLKRDEERTLNTRIKLEAQKLRATEKAIAVDRKAARETKKLTDAYEREKKTLRDLQKEFKRVAIEEGLASKNTIRLGNELLKLDRKLSKVEQAAGQFQRQVGKYPKVFQGAITVLGALGFTGVIFSVISAVKEAFTTIVDFDKQLIAVGKTANLSGDDLLKFSNDVIELGLSLKGVSIEGLLKSSAIAGQLGIKGSKNILAFAETVEKLALTSNLIGEESVLEFAKFIQVVGESASNSDKLGSIITRLGNNFATTEKDIVSNASEISKGIAVYKNSASNILALGAATSSLGNAAESSRSAIQSTFAVLNDASSSGKNLNKVLEILNITEAELSKQFKNDASSVFIKLVEGLSKIDKQGGNLKNTLTDLGITEKRAFTVIGTLAKRYDVLSSSVSQANEEYITNNALNKEVEASTKSLSSQIGDVLDNWAALVLSIDSGNGIISKSIRFITGELNKLINTFLFVNANDDITFRGIAKSADDTLEKILKFGEITQNILTGSSINVTGSGTIKKQLDELFKFYDLEDIIKSSEIVGSKIGTAQSKFNTFFLEQGIGIADINALWGTFLKGVKSAREEELKTAKELEKQTSDARRKAIEDEAKRVESLGFIEKAEKSLKELRDKKHKSTDKREIAILNTQIKAQQRSLAFLKDFRKEQLKVDEANEKRRIDLLDNSIFIKISKEQLRYEKELRLAKEHGENLILVEKKHAKKLSKIKDDLFKSSLEAKEIEFKDGSQAEDDARIKAQGKEIEDRKENADLLRKQKLEENEARIQLITAVIDKVSQIEDALSRKRLDSIRNEISMFGEQRNLLKEQAAKGNEDALNSIQNLDKRQTELEAQREQELNKRKTAELLLIALKLLSANLNSGSNGNEAISKTAQQIGQTTALVQSLPSFESGIDDTTPYSKGSGVDGKGGFTATLHSGEKVLNATDTAKTGGVSNQIIGDVMQKYNSGQLTEMNKSFSDTSATIYDNSELVQEMKNTAKTISKAIASNTIRYDELEKALIQSVKDGSNYIDYHNKVGGL